MWKNIQEFTTIFLTWFFYQSKLSVLIIVLLLIKFLVSLLGKIDMLLNQSLMKIFSISTLPLMTFSWFHNFYILTLEELPIKIMGKLFLKKPRFFSDQMCWYLFQTVHGVVQMITSLWQLQYFNVFIGQTKTWKTKGDY